MRFMTFCALLALAACDAEPGEKGDPGTDGADGTDGASGSDGSDGADGAAGTDGSGFDYAFSGTVSTSTGAAAGAPVTLELLSAEGEVLASVGGAITGTDGTFSIHLANIDTPSALMRFNAATSEGTLTALVHDSDVGIDAASTAVEEIINMIVASEGGRTLYDFDLKTIGTLVSDASASLSGAGTDLTDADAVLARVLNDVGGDIADASGGVYDITEGDFVISEDPPDVVTTASSSYYQYLYDGDGYEWQVYTLYGYIYGYSGTTYDNYGYFYVNGSSPYWSGAYSGTTFEDDTEVVLGPLTYPPSGVQWYRKIHISPNYPYARFLEILINTTDEDIEVDTYFYGNLNGYGITYDYTSSGDSTVDSTDSWLATSNAGYAPVAAAFPGADLTSSNTNDSIYAYWDTTVVPANGRTTFIHWHRQGDDIDDLGKEMAADFGSDGIPTSAIYYEGLTLQDLADHHVDIVEANAVGEAGSVAPYAELYFTNASSGASFTGVAASDGSFSVVVAAVSGETVLLEASDGTSDSVTIP